MVVNIWMVPCCRYNWPSLGSVLSSAALVLSGEDRYYAGLIVDGANLITEFSFSKLYETLLEQSTKNL